MTEKTNKQRSVWDWSFGQQWFGLFALLLIGFTFPVGEAFGIVSLTVWAGLAVILILCVNYLYPLLFGSVRVKDQFDAFKEAGRRARTLETLGRDGDGLPTPRRQNDQN